MARLDLYVDGVWTRAIVLGQRKHLVGREPVCDLVVEDQLASRKHFTIEPVTPTMWRLTDLDTPNGTLVNGVREFSKELREAATLVIGGDLILFDPDGEGDEAPATSAIPTWALPGDAEEHPSEVPSTADIAPVHLRKLQANVRARTRPHLAGTIGGETQVFALDAAVTTVGIGRSVRVSVGRGPDKVLFEVIGNSRGRFKARAKGLFAKLSVNGKQRHQHTLHEGDTIEVGDVTLTFRTQLVDKE